MPARRHQVENVPGRTTSASLSAHTTAPRLLPYSSDKLRFPGRSSGWGQPALHRAQVHAFAAVVVFHLVAIDFSHGKVFRLRDARNRIRSPRPPATWQSSPSDRFRYSSPRAQVEELALLGVVGAGGISRRGTDAAIALVDQSRASGFSPCHNSQASRALLCSQLCQRFRQAVGEALVMMAL